MLELSYADQARFCSEMFKKGMDGLSAQGVPYYDDRAYQLARRAVQTSIPNMLKMSGERILIGADRGVLIDGSQSEYFGGVKTLGRLSGVKIQEIRETCVDGAGSFEVVYHDLAAIVTPRFDDPDPVDLVFGQELVIPFGSITEIQAEV